MSLLERGNAESLPLQRRLSQVPASQVATTIITYEEQMRGWMALLAKANAPNRMVIAYAKLHSHIATFSNIPIAPVTEASADILGELQTSRVRIETMDLKIASITISLNETLITRNLADFQQVPNLN